MCTLPGIRADVFERQSVANVLLCRKRYLKSGDGQADRYCHSTLPGVYHKKSRGIATAWRSVRKPDIGRGLPLLSHLAWSYDVRYRNAAERWVSHDIGIFDRYL